MSARSKPVGCFFHVEEGNYLARSNTERVQRLPPGHYKFDQESDGFHFHRDHSVIESKVVLDDDQAEIAKTVDRFWESGAQYERLGFAHKRGILLAGKPGTGKTTITRHLCQNVWKRGGLSFFTGDISELGPAMRALRSATAPVLIAIEDIDGWTNQDSYLTNFLDGMSGLNRVLIVATTNYLEKVSERLKGRPGRFDDVLMVGYPGTKVRREFIASKIPDNPALVDALVSMTAGISMAHIKEVLVRQLILGGCTPEMMAELREQCGAKAPAESKAKQEIVYASARIIG